MAEVVAESEIYQRLSRIAHPEIRNKNLVELGMIAGVCVDGEHVRITLALPYPKVPIKDELVRLVRQAVSGTESDLQAEVDIEEMTSQQRDNFLAQVKEEQTVSPKASQIARVIAVMSGKGGVGKSSVTGLLASALRRRDFQVGVLDADVTGPSIPKLFGAQQSLIAGPEGPMPVESTTGIKLISANLLLSDEGQAVIWRGPMISKVIEQFWRDIVWGKLDYLIVDLPPGTSDAALTVMQSLPLNGIVLVSSPQDLAGMVVRKAANMAVQIGVPILGLLENMSYLTCPECKAHIDAYGSSRAGETARQVGIEMLGSLPLDPHLAVMCDQGKVETYHVETFELVVDRILEMESVKVPVDSGAEDQLRSRTG
jgi:Mrp family chromosome partitioning ATPase